MLFAVWNEIVGGGSCLKCYVSILFLTFHFDEYETDGLREDLGEDEDDEVKDEDEDER